MQDGRLVGCHWELVKGKFATGKEQATKQEDTALFWRDYLAGRRIRAEKKLRFARSPRRIRERLRDSRWMLNFHPPGDRLEHPIREL